MWHFPEVANCEGASVLWNVLFPNGLIPGEILLCGGRWYSFSQWWDHCNLLHLTELHCTLRHYGALHVHRQNNIFDCLSFLFLHFWYQARGLFSCLHCWLIHSFVHSKPPGRKMVGISQWPKHEDGWNIHNTIIYLKNITGIWYKGSRKGGMIITEVWRG